MLNLSSQFNLTFFNKSENYERVTIPESSDVTHVTITLPAVDTSGYLSCRISSSNAVKFYVDKISIKPNL